jgi:allantoinase
MSVGKTYFDYPHRRPGLDHDRFAYRNLFKTKTIAWPGGARVALWVTVHLDFFPLDMGATPFRPIGAVERTYPDYWNYTLRDYGNRVGVFRVMRALERHGVKASAAMNSDVAVRYPALLRAATKAGWEVVASGVNMGRLHHSGLAIEDERALVAEAIGTLRRLSGQTVLGWHSPAHAESPATLDLVAAEGIAYVADWINDDMPFPLRTASGTLHAMPLTHELSDRTILWQTHQSSDDYAEQALAAFRTLFAEAREHGGRILSLAIHPWITGQPHRLRSFERVLHEITAHAGVWPATGAEVLAAYKAQAG